MSDWKTDYPSRFYAYSNAAMTLGGFPSVGWVDVSIFTLKPDWLPQASEMIPLTETEWNSRSSADQIIKDGAISDYVLPTTEPAS